MNKIPELPGDFEKRAKDKLAGRRGEGFAEVMKIRRERKHGTKKKGSSEKSEKLSHKNDRKPERDDTIQYVEYDVDPKRISREACIGWIIRNPKKI